MKRKVFRLVLKVLGLIKNTPPDRLNPDSGYNALWGWFSLSRASWLAIPRVLMHEMPDAWQGKMAALLEEWDDHWNWPDDIGKTAVFQRDEKGRLVGWPDWITQYRHPYTGNIESIKRKPLREDFLIHKRIPVDKSKSPGLF